MKNVVLVGAGHAHVGVLRAFGSNPVPGVRLTLITRALQTPYSGMLPGMIAGHYTADQAHIDTGLLCGFADARLYHSEAIGLDPVAKVIHCNKRAPVPYDIASLDIGSTPGMQNISGVAAHAIPVKPVDGFLQRFDAARARILANRSPQRIGMIGAGAGGVELLLALQWCLLADLRKAGRDAAHLAFIVVTPGDEVLASMPAKMRRRFTEIMRTRNIEIVAGSKVTAVEPGVAILDGGRRLPLDEIFWTTRAEPAGWLRQTGLALDREGFVRVRQTLQTMAFDDIFAVGDVAAIEGYDVPKSGVYAVRSAGSLERNIRNLIAGAPLTTYTPQRNALYLISTGDRHAIGTRNGVTFEGAWVWWLKDWIDRRFMDAYKNLPAKSAP